MQGEEERMTYSEWVQTKEGQEATGGKYARNSLDNGGGSGKMKSGGYDFLDGILGSDAIPKEQSQKLDDIISVIPKKHLDVIGKTVQEVVIEQNRGRCSYDPVNKKLILDPDKMNDSIIHECGHILADAYDIYNNKDFLSVLTDGLNLVDGYDVKPFYFESEKEWIYWVSNPKFISEYQGRVYIDIDNFSCSDALDPKCFQEYISVGFDAFFKNPELLKEKDVKLYNYLERMINGG